MCKDTAVIERFFAVLPPISADCHAVLPWLGLYRGREAVKEFLAHVHRNRAVTPFGRRGVIFEGNKAAAFGWFRLHALPTGSTTDLSYSVLFELRNGSQFETKSHKFMEISAGRWQPAVLQMHSREATLVC